MISFYDLKIDVENDKAIIPDILRKIIDKVQEYKAYERKNCSGSDQRHRLIDIVELSDKYSEEPYKTLNKLYKDLEQEAYKLPYSILYKIEACMVCGMDISDMYRYRSEDCEELDGAFDINTRDSISLRDYEALAYYYDIPTKEKTNRLKQDLIEYVLSKKNLDIYLRLYLRACGI